MLSGGIDIVVGMDQLYQKVSITNIIKHPNLSLILLNTIWGYSLGGAVEDKNGAEKLNKTLLLANFTTNTSTEPTFTEMEATIQQNMEQLFQNERVAESETKLTAEEEYAERHFLETIRLENGQYTVNPLLREKCVPLQNNFNIAIHRYKSLRKGLESIQS